MDETMQEALIEKMRKWFFQHFEDPAENTPYMTSEGGYIWVHGGPYDAREELQAAFGHEVPEDLINELADELTQQCWEWAPVAVPEYDDEYYSDRYQEYEYIDVYGNFKKAIKNIETLLNVEIDKTAQQHLHRMLFVSVITAMETYLSDAFINTVMPEQDLLRKLVETSPEFKKKTIALSELFNSMENIREEVKRYLSEISWHHLQRITPMYKATLNVDFPKDLGEVYKAIRTRHDIVHRNGKTLENEEVKVGADEVIGLIVAVSGFIAQVDSSLHTF